MAETIYESMHKTNMILVDRIIDFQLKNDKKFNKIKDELKKNISVTEELQKKLELTDKASKKREIDFFCLEKQLEKTNEKNEEMKKQLDLTEQIALATQKMTLDTQTMTLETQKLVTTNEKILSNLANRIDRIEKYALARIDKRLDMFNERLKLRESPLTIDTINTDDNN